jgi:hypothetical protein
MSRINTINKEFLSFFKDHKIDLKSQFLIGVSGGNDSMAVLLQVVRYVASWARYSVDVPCGSKLRVPESVIKLFHKLSMAVLETAQEVESLLSRNITMHQSR